MCLPRVLLGLRIFFLLGQGNHINVPIVNTDIYEHGPGGAVQPRVVLQRFDQSPGVRSLFRKIEIKTAGSVVSDLALVRHGLSYRTIGIRPSVKIND